MPTENLYMKDGVLLVGQAAIDAFKHHQVFVDTVMIVMGVAVMVLLTVVVWAWVVHIVKD
jgi:hypothetical protein